MLNNLDYIKIKHFCKAKEFISKMKRQPRQPIENHWMKRENTCKFWEKILANHISDKWLIYKIKRTHTTSQQKKKKIKFKNKPKIQLNSFPKKIYRWPTRTLKKKSSTLLIIRDMLWDVTRHLLEWLLRKRQETTSVGKKVEKRHIVSGNINRCSHYGK